MEQERMTLTPAEIDALAEKVEAMTEGPWAKPFLDEHPGDEGWWLLAGQGSTQHAIGATVLYNRNAEADAGGIAALRNNADALIEAARMLGKLERAAAEQHMETQEYVSGLVSEASQGLLVPFHADEEEPCVPAGLWWDACEELERLRAEAPS